MWKNHKGFTLVESILSLGICITFCLLILPLIVTIVVKADEAEERSIMYGIAYEQMKIYQVKGTVESSVVKEGGEYLIEFRPDTMCVSNEDSVRVCVQK
ncbi:competence type IV pilus minor pilin ComGE [Jeotgalibacillus salarius]|uniref:Type II secretion system protein n=1 Tax=Jeotgalibacillus salarius TaxID=546023 RepID=A0A4Y8L906_9BACL|nr:competence type IV pilus minor pilin ComGE [Jeotgalibacillus salarius]TFD97530.1 type II secretion system protein [Jeotgalibacillus salarius]